MSGIAKQWDVGASAFSIGGGALSLLKAASVDNVHPSAVYVAEAIGGFVTVEPRLIGSAVDALGGGESFRLANLRLTIGLTSGGVAAEVRKSTRAIRCFLLMTGLRLFLQKDEIAEVLYELHVQSSQINNMPVSETQLASLVDVLQAHSLKLFSSTSITTTFMHPFTDALSRHSAAERSTSTQNHNRYFEPLPSHDMAGVLYHIFTTLLSEDVSRLIIKGSQGAVQIISIFSWIMPQDVAVQFEGEWILGGSAAEQKRLQFVLTEQTSWRFEEYVGVQRIQTLIDTQSEPQIWDNSTVNIPQNSVRAYYICEYGVRIADIIAQVALAMIITSYQHLTLRVKGGRQKLPLRRICSHAFRLSHTQSLERFGWDTKQIIQPASEVVSWINESVAREEFGKAQKTARENQYVSDSRFFSRRLYHQIAFPKYLMKKFSLEDLEAITCVDEATMVAVSVIFRSTITETSRSMENYQSFDRARILLHMITPFGESDLDPHEFFRLVQLISEPSIHGAYRSGTDNIILSAGGLVLYPTTLFSHSTRIEDLFTYTLVLGQLRLKDVHYPSLVETKQSRQDGLQFGYDKVGMPIFDDPNSIDDPKTFQVPYLRDTIIYSLSKNADYLILHTESKLGKPLSFSDARRQYISAHRPQKEEEDAVLPTDSIIRHHRNGGPILQIMPARWLANPPGISVPKELADTIFLGARMISEEFFQPDCAIVPCCAQDPAANFYRAGCFGLTAIEIVLAEDVPISTCVKYVESLVENEQQTGPEILRPIYLIFPT